MKALNILYVAVISVVQKWFCSSDFSAVNLTVIPAKCHIHKSKNTKEKPHCVVRQDIRIRLSCSGKIIKAKNVHWCCFCISVHILSTVWSLCIVYVQSK